MAAKKGSDVRVDEREDQSFTAPTGSSALAPYRSADMLGAPIATFALDRAEQRARRVWGFGSGLIALVAALLAPFGAMESTFTAILCALVAAGFAMLAFVALRAYASERAARIEALDFGLRVMLQGAAKDIPWDAIGGVFAEYTSGTHENAASTPVLTELGLRDGTRVPMPRAVRDASALAALVYARTIDVMIADAREAVAAGAQVSFGPIVVSSKGVFANGTAFLWSEQPLARVKGPFLEVGALYNALPPSMVFAGSVANIHVLIELLRDPAAITAAAPPASSVE